MWKPFHVENILSRDGKPILCINRDNLRKISLHNAYCVENYNESTWESGVGQYWIDSAFEMQVVESGIWVYITIANVIDQEQLKLIMKISSTLPATQARHKTHRVHLNAITFSSSCSSSAGEQISFFVIIVFCAGFFVEFKKFNRTKISCGIPYIQRCFL